MSDGTICWSCDGPAAVGPVRTPDGGIAATAGTDCPMCGSWTISMRDTPFLDKETTETRRRTSARVRELFKADPIRPVVVDEGFILSCRHERA